MLEVYFHVGLGKTGTKYLQFDFFPKLRGIEYIHTTKYRKSKKIIKKRGEGRFLVSREFDERFEREVRWFAQDFPDAGPIIVLRRQDEWILSQFKRYVKNGHRYRFKEFFNLEGTGLFKVEDLYFHRRIELLEETFERRPLVLLYDELREEPYRFFDRIAQYTGTTYERESIPLRRRHRSYSEKQLKVIYKLSEHLDIVPRGILKKYLFVYPIRYPVLYLARYLPAKAVPKLDIFPSREELEGIREFYRDDWERCVEYARCTGP